MINDIANQSQSPQGNDYNSLLGALDKPPIPTDFEQAVLQRTMLAELPKATPPDLFEQTVLQKIKSTSTSKLVKWIFAGVGAVAIIGITWFATANSVTNDNTTSQKIVKPISQPVDTSSVDKSSSDKEAGSTQNTVLPSQAETRLNNKQIGKIVTSTDEHPTTQLRYDKHLGKQAKEVSRPTKQLLSTGKPHIGSIKSKQDATKKNQNTRVEVDKGGKIPQRLLDEE